MCSHGETRKEHTVKYRDVLTMEEYKEKLQASMYVNDTCRSRDVKSKNQNFLIC